MSKTNKTPSEFEILKSKDLNQLNNWHKECRKEYEKILSFIDKYKKSKDYDFRSFSYLEALKDKRRFEEKLEIISSRKSELEIIKGRQEKVDLSKRIKVNNGKEMSKRFRIDQKIKAKCTGCGHDIEFLGETRYLMNPVVGDAEGAYAYCHNCESEFNLPVKLEMTIEYDLSKLEKL